MFTSGSLDDSPPEAPNPARSPTFLPPRAISLWRPTSPDAPLKSFPLPLWSLTSHRQPRLLFEFPSPPGAPRDRRRPTPGASPPERERERGGEERETHEGADREGLGPGRVRVVRRPVGGRAQGQEVRPDQRRRRVQQERSHLLVPGRVLPHARALAPPVRPRHGGLRRQRLALQRLQRAHDAHAVPVAQHHPGPPERRDRVQGLDHVHLPRRPRQAEPALREVPLLPQLEPRPAFDGLLLLRPVGPDAPQVAPAADVDRPPHLARQQQGGDVLEDGLEALEPHVQSLGEAAQSQPEAAQERAGPQAPWPTVLVRPCVIAVVPTSARGRPAGAPPPPSHSESVHFVS